jgi:hypothetical protein
VSFGEDGSEESGEQRTYCVVEVPSADWCPEQRVLDTAIRRKVGIEERHGWAAPTARTGAARQLGPDGEDAEDESR